MEEDNEFDPLSFLSSAPIRQNVEEIPGLVTTSETQLGEETEDRNVDDEEKVEDSPKSGGGDNEDDDSIRPLHILDLPMLKSKPPADILTIFLKLLGRGEIFNFGTKKELNKSIDIEDELKGKSIEILDFNRSLTWFELNTPAIGNVNQLLNLADGIKHNPEYVPYLTSIVSSSLDWIEDMDDKETIWNLASMRISETGGHFLSSQFIRQIVLDDFKEILKLKEPSVTEDNLGLKTWGSSLVLSQRLVRDHKKLLKEPIIELGAGTGLVGVTCAKLGYARLTLTDLPEIVGNLYDNLELNDIPVVMGEESHSDVQVDVLDWSQPQGFIEKYPNSQEGYSTIILSDPIYSPMHPIWVGDMISRLSRKDKESRVLLQIPIRERFEKERSLMFQVMEELRMDEIESYDDHGVDDFGKKDYVFKVYKWRV